MDPAQTAEGDILRYLIAHPEARDTLEGIEKWWLPRLKPYAVGDVSEALRRLEEQGLVRVWTSPLTQPLYGCSSAGTDPLIDYLRNLERP
jgi:hypothetical protein